MRQNVSLYGLSGLGGSRTALLMLDAGVDSFLVRSLIDTVLCEKLREKGKKEAIASGDLLIDTEVTSAAPAACLDFWRRADVHAK